MSPSPVEFEVWFDYTCPFAYRAHQWLEQLPGAPRWRPFSLLERNYRGEGPPVWRLAERADDISLLLFAGHERVVAGGGDLAVYRRAAFKAWHDGDRRLGLDDVVRFVQAAGVVGDDAAVRAHFFDAQSEHDTARGLGVFGSPTLVFGPDQAVFVKLDQVPAADRAGRVLDAVITLSELPSVLEVQRLVVPAEARDDRTGS